MARNLVEQPFNQDLKYIEWYGLSTETKPTIGIVTGSFAYETDTGDAYFFEETTGTWTKAGGE